MHDGYCLPEHTVISYFALTETNSLHCILAGSTAGTGGEWTDPAKKMVCKESALFVCTQTQDLTLYGNSTSFTNNEQGSYTCNFGGQTITVQIVGE